MANDHLRRAVTAARRNTAAEKAAAAHLVHRHATDPSDEQQLLDALGLNAKGEQ
jgi:hypothetical protein